jgi:hypothetical protein
VGKDLLGGDLNDDDRVDILDFGLFVGQFGADYDSDLDGQPDGNAPCGTTSPHADFNGDGTVDSLDLSFITVNFLLEGEPPCCAAAAASGGAVRPDHPIAAISLGKLDACGLGHLAVADLTGDGSLDPADIAAFLAGARP